MDNVCYRHPDRPTALSCTRCGRSACPECLRTASVGHHCVDCVNEGRATTRADDPVTAQSGPDAKPYITYGLIAVNAVLFVIAQLQENSYGFSEVMLRGSLVSGMDTHNEYWRLITSGFLHWSAMHLAVNMLSLYFVGPQLERLFGPSRYLAIYLISLLGGSGLVMALERNPTLTAGASGAIYGLMGALLVVVIKMKLSPTMVLAVIGFNLVLSIGLPNISLYGHLGGLIFGALAAAAVIWLPAKVLPPEKRVMAEVSRVGWYGLTVLAVIAIALGTVFAATAG